MTEVDLDPTPTVGCALDASTQQLCVVSVVWGERRRKREDERRRVSGGWRERGREGERERGRGRAGEGWNRCNKIGWEEDAV